MRLTMLFSFVLLAQTAIQTATLPVSADPTEHLRYERAVQVPSLPAGVSDVCTVLDADAFAHAASSSGDDLRLFRMPEGTPSGATDTPFTLLESEAAPEDTVAATVQNIAVHGNTLGFDLAMPNRAYSLVRLRLAGRDFLAEAVVSGAPAPGRTTVQLGSFTLFDLSGEHLWRSTDLQLQEARLPRLHVELRFWKPDGTPVDRPQPGVVLGAEVPPSREAQTLYTTVAAASPIPADGAANLVIPAHLPVERVRFVLDPAFNGSFLSKVVIGASPDSSPSTIVDGNTAAESAQGTVGRVDRPAPGGDAPSIHYASLAIDDTLGSNLRGPARVHIAIQKPAGQRLPVRSVELQMRQRTLCFRAIAGAPYRLFYGDAGLVAPVYHSEDGTTDSLGKDVDSEDESASMGTPAGSTDAADEDGRLDPPAKPLLALLGPERQNPGFVAQPRQAAAREHHPEMFWVGLLSIVTLASGLAAHRVRYEREKA